MGVPVAAFPDSEVLALRVKQCVGAGEHTLYEVMALSEVIFASILNTEDGSMACKAQAVSWAWQRSAPPHRHGEHGR